MPSRLSRARVDRSSDEIAGCPVSDTPRHRPGMGPLISKGNVEWKPACHIGPMTASATGSIRANGSRGRAGWSRINKMKVLQKAKQSWSEVRWKMLVIFAFLSIISTLLVVSCAAALLNVVIRRANASLMEEQINGVMDSWSRFTPLLLERVPCGTSPSDSLVPQIYPTTTWPEGRISLTVAPRGALVPMTATTWSDDGSLAGIVNDRGSLEIRAFPFGRTRGMLDLGAGPDTAHRIASEALV